MRGTILGVHDGRGVLLSLDDRRLEFPLSEWRSAAPPTAGQIVDFLEANGQAAGVFAVPGAAAAGAASGSRVLAWIAIACLVVGFIIPFLPTIAAFVLGVIGAGQAQQEHDETALLVSRIAWIGAAVLLVVGALIVIAVLGVIGTVGFAAAWHGLGPMDF
jgi:hypothetical protein